MRFALMSEPQQGLSYEEILALARARRAPAWRRTSGPITTPASPARGDADDRRLGDAGRPGPRHGPHPPGLARLAGHVPHPRRIRQGGRHRGRDERRSHRGRDRRRVERGRARPARDPVSGARSSATTIRGGRRADPWPMDASRTAGASRESTGRCAGRDSSRGRPGRPPTPAHHPRRTRRTAPGAAGRALCRRAQHRLRDTGAGRRSLSAPGGGLRAGRPRPGRHHALGHDRRPAGRIEADLRGRSRQLLETTAEPGTDAQAWLAERRGRWIMGTLEEAAERVDALGRPASSGSCCRTSCPATWT